MSSGSVTWDPADVFGCAQDSVIGQEGTKERSVLRLQQRWEGDVVRLMEVHPWYMREGELESNAQASQALQALDFHTTWNWEPYLAWKLHEIHAIAGRCQRGLKACSLQLEKHKFSSKN